MFVIATTSQRRPIVLLSKLIDKISYRNYKRTWQEVSNVFWHYWYNRYIVYTNNK